MIMTQDDNDNNDDNVDDDEDDNDDNNIVVDIVTRHDTAVHCRNT